MTRYASHQVLVAFGNNGAHQDVNDDTIKNSVIFVYRRLLEHKSANTEFGLTDKHFKIIKF